MCRARHLRNPENNRSKKAPVPSPHMVHVLPAHMPPHCVRVTTEEKDILHSEQVIGLRVPGPARYAAHFLPRHLDQPRCALSVRYDLQIRRSVGAQMTGMSGSPVRACDIEKLQKGT